ncbi:unnamed protein product [Echinostoma caproni]|uniref:cystathionine beta-synthase n=1 Tax=Echinostoma caproni TaxID=27848 RepID=A0A183AJY1_9TREM|nr:unnamed protein product [Echinostoma caproni]
MGDEDWTRPDLPSKCTYAEHMPVHQSPHFHNPYWTRPRIATSSLDLIGCTPLVRLNSIPKSEGLQCEVLAKCEFLNSGGSVKDRIAKRMVEEAERSGLLKPGDTIIEPTSGNTGIGLALVAAIKGYRCIIVMPEKMSKEKEFMLRGLGAEIIRTRTSANFDDEDSHVRIAERLKQEIGPTAHILNQYINPYNPIEHYDQTAEEILRDCTEPDGHIRLNVLVAGAGTGGTITGLSRKIKTRLPTCQIVGVDPEGSILADLTADNPQPYDVEGIGYDFIPTVLDRSGVDKWYKTIDPESLLMARRILREEGLLCGGSSGAALVAALQAAHDFSLGKDDRLVVILPDSIRNYMTKFLSDGWMYNRGFIDLPAGKEFRNNWMHKSVGELLRTLPKPVIVTSDQTIKQVVTELNECGSSHAIVQVSNVDKSILGLFDSVALQTLLTGSASPSDPVKHALDKGVRQLPSTVHVEELGRRLMIEPVVIVTDKTDHWLITQEDFLKWAVTQCI